MTANIHKIASTGKPSTKVLDEFKHLWRIATKTDKDHIKAIIEGVDVSTKEMKKWAIEAVDFLNLKTGRHYRAVGPTLEMLVARFRSGITLQQVKSVIAKKSMEWRHDEKMEKFLRPKTLFGRENFENYLGELGEDSE